MAEIFKVGYMVTTLLTGGVVLSGCATTAGNIALGAAGVTTVGAFTPANEMEQIYYLGVFDPHEQIPPTIYRVRVHGQASIFSDTKFASGWVKASLIDSLGTGAQYDQNGALGMQSASDKVMDQLKTGRRLMLFGPEGFREAPKDHRLVIVMGQSPEKYFAAIDESLGVISQAKAEQRNANLIMPLFKALQEVKNERERLEDLKREVEIEMAKDN